MEQSVQELRTSFHDAVQSISRVMTALEARGGPVAAQGREGGGQGGLQPALADFYGHAEFFRSSCDSLQAQLENARHKLLCETLVDEARGVVLPLPSESAAVPSTGSAAGAAAVPGGGAAAGTGADAGTGGAVHGGGAGANAGEGAVRSEEVVVLSATRLEQLSKAVRAVVQDLQQSSSQLKAAYPPPPHPPHPSHPPQLQTEAGNMDPVQKGGPREGETRTDSVVERGGRQEHAVADKHQGSTPMELEAKNPEGQLHSTPSQAGGQARAE